MKYRSASEREISARIYEHQSLDGHCRSRILARKLRIEAIGNQVVVSPLISAGLAGTAGCWRNCSNVAGSPLTCRQRDRV